MNSLGEFDHAPLFESIQEIFSYALACIASNTPESGRVPSNARASHEGGSDGEDGGTGGAGGAQGFRSEGSDSSKWIDPNTISKTVQEVNTKSVDRKDSFPIWRDFHPECGFFREGNCRDGPECCRGKHVIDRDNFRSCLWCGNAKHVLKDCMHRQQKHPDWTDAFLRKVLKFPNRAGKNVADVQYYCGSIVNDQLVGNVPILPCASTCAPCAPSSSFPAVESSTPRLGVVQTDTHDLANLNALRSTQRTSDISAESCGDTLCKQHEPSKDDPRFCQCGKLIGELF